MGILNYLRDELKQLVQNEKDHNERVKTLKSNIKNIKQQNADKVKRFEMLKEHFFKFHHEPFNLILCDKKIIFQTWLKLLLTEYINSQSHSSSALRQFIYNMRWLQHDQSNLFENFNWQTVSTKNGSTGELDAQLQTLQKQCYTNNQSDIISLLFKDLRESCNQQQNEYEIDVYAKLSSLDPMLINDNLFRELIQDDVSLLYESYAKRLNLNISENNIAFPNLSHLNKQLETLLRQQTGYADELWGKAEYMWLIEKAEFDLWSKTDSPNPYVVPYMLLDIGIEYAPKEKRVSYHYDQMNEQYVNSNINLNDKVFNVVLPNIKDTEKPHTVSFKKHKWQIQNSHLYPQISKLFTVFESESIVAWDTHNLNNLLNIWFVASLPKYNSQQIPHPFYYATQSLTPQDLNELEIFFTQFNQRVAEAVFQHPSIQNVWQNNMENKVIML